MNETDIEKIKSEFGKRVRDLRLKKGITQSDLAQKMGVDLRQIQRIENAEINTSLVSIYKLIIALDVNPNELFGF